MSTLITTVLAIIIITALGYLAAKEEHRLKSASVVFLVILLLSSSTLSTEWGRMTSELVDNDEFGQIFITDTHSDRIKNIIQRSNKSYQIFKI